MILSQCLEGVLLSLLLVKPALAARREDFVDHGGPMLNPVFWDGMKTWNLAGSISPIEAGTGSRSGSNKQIYDGQRFSMDSMKENHMPLVVGAKELPRYTNMNDPALSREQKYNNMVDFTGDPEICMQPHGRTGAWGPIGEDYPTHNFCAEVKRLATSISRRLILQREQEREMEEKMRKIYQAKKDGKDEAEQVSDAEKHVGAQNGVVKGGTGRPSSDDTLEEMKSTWQKRRGYVPGQMPSPQQVADYKWSHKSYQGFELPAPVYSDRAMAELKKAEDKAIEENAAYWDKVKRPADKLRDAGIMVPEGSSEVRKSSKPAKSPKLPESQKPKDPPKPTKLAPRKIHAKMLRRSVSTPKESRSWRKRKTKTPPKAPKKPTEERKSKWKHYDPLKEYDIKGATAIEKPRKPTADPPEMLEVEGYNPIRPQRPDRFIDIGKELDPKGVWPEDVEYKQNKKYIHHPHPPVTGPIPTATPLPHGKRYSRSRKQWGPNHEVPAQFDDKDEYARWFGSYPGTPQSSQLQDAHKVGWKVRGVNPNVWSDETGHKLAFGSHEEYPMGFNVNGDVMHHFGWGDMRSSDLFDDKHLYDDKTTN